MGEGMPYYKNPFEKGRLIIQFTVNFPTQLPPEKIPMLESCLPPRWVVISDFLVLAYEYTALQLTNPVFVISDRKRWFQKAPKSAYWWTSIPNQTGGMPVAHTVTLMTKTNQVREVVEYSALRIKFFWGRGSKNWELDIKGTHPVLFSISNHFFFNFPILNRTKRKKKWKASRKFRNYKLGLRYHLCWDFGYETREPSVAHEWMCISFVFTLFDFSYR